MNIFYKKHSDPFNLFSEFLDTHEQAKLRKGLALQPKNPPTTDDVILATQTAQYLTPFSCITGLTYNKGQLWDTQTQQYLVEARQRLAGIVRSGLAASTLSPITIFREVEWRDTGALCHPEFSKNIATFEQPGPLDVVLLSQGHLGATGLLMYGNLILMDLSFKRSYVHSDMAYWFYLDKKGAGTAQSEKMKPENTITRIAPPAKLFRFWYQAVIREFVKIAGEVIVAKRKLGDPTPSIEYLTTLVSNGIFRLTGDTLIPFISTLGLLLAQLKEDSAPLISAIAGIAGMFMVRQHCGTDTELCRTSNSETLLWYLASMNNRDLSMSKINISIYRETIRQQIEKLMVEYRMHPEIQMTRFPGSDEIPLTVKISQAASEVFKANRTLTHFAALNIISHQNRFSDWA